MKKFPIAFPTPRFAVVGMGKTRFAKSPYYVKNAAAVASVLYLEITSVIVEISTSTILPVLLAHTMIAFWPAMTILIAIRLYG